MILVTGATGNIGKPLVRELAEKRAGVRVLVRDAKKAPPDVEVAVGDLDDAAAVARATRGVDSAFMLCASPAQEASFVESAKKAGVKRVVMLSSGGVPFAVGGGPAHAAGEEILRASGLAWTILRPWEFMSNALRWIPTVRAQGSVFEPAGDGKTPLIDPRDIAAVAAHVLVSEGHDGKIYDLTGPVAIGRAEMVETLAKAIGKPLRYVDTPETAFGDQMTKMGLPAFVLEPVLGFYRMVREGKMEETKPDVERLLGRKARSFADWVAENARAFA
ncbi:MAG TPA: SDR family oxidoreductase [Polyangiaceae bacterium]